MNVIVSNRQQALLANLNIDIIKTINGEFTADEIVEQFSNFFFGRMILDLTALKDYKDLRNLQKISISLAVEKIIIVLPLDDPECNTPQFLSKLISMGVYNFTSNIEGINYLLQNPNSYRDVAHLHQIDEPIVIEKQVMVPGENTTTYVQSASTVIGIKNLTDGAGATTLCNLIKKELKNRGMSVVAIEVGKRDFMYLNDKELISTTEDDLSSVVLRNRDKQVILVDLNRTEPTICTDVIYLLEPSFIKLNKLMFRDRKVFERLKGKKIMLSKSMLSNSDMAELEYEAKTKFFYNMPVIDDRQNNTEILEDLLIRLGIVYRDM